MNPRLALWLRCGRARKLHQANLGNGTHMANGFGLWYCFGRLHNKSSFRCYSITDLHKSLLQNISTHLLRPRREAWQCREDKSLNNDDGHLSHISSSWEKMTWIRVSMEGWQISAPPSDFSPTQPPSTSLCLLLKLLVKLEINPCCSYPNRSL